MTSEYLNGQLGVFLKCETTKMKLAKNKKMIFKQKYFCMKYFIKYLCYLSFGNFLRSSLNKSVLQ